MSTRLIIVGGNKGGVGKTTFARLTLDYAGAAAERWRVFDGQSPLGSLKRFHPAAEVVAFNLTEGRMRVLDGIEDRVTLIDLAAGSLSDSLRILRDAGFLADVAADRAELTVMHVIGPNVDSIREAAEIAGLLADGGSHVLVRNCANDEQFAWNPKSYDQMLQAVAPAAIIDIPHLDGTAREAVDVAGTSFAKFAREPFRSNFLRRLVAKWEEDCFVAMSVAKLHNLIGG